MINLNLLYEAVLAGKHIQAMELTKEAIDEKISPKEIIDNYLIKAMEEIGRRFEAHKAFVPELLMAGRAMKSSLSLLQPLLKGEDAHSSIGTIVIGTVKGDLHDIGKNLVGSMFEGCGFQVVDLGVDVDAAKFIQAVKDMKARFNIGDTIPEIKEEDIPKLAGYADKEANPLYPVPVLMDAKTLERFYYNLMIDNTQEYEV